MNPRASSIPLRWLIAAIVVVLIGAVAWTARSGFSSGKPPQRPLVDDRGPRIVALSPALAIMLIDLGLSDRIVGRHGYDLALDKSVPVCGDQSTTDYEALIGTGPTDILLERGAGEVPPRMRSLAAANHWTISEFPLLALDDIPAAIRRLGDMFHRTDDPAFADRVRRMSAAWSVPHAPINAGRILLLESIDPPAALGPGSFHYQILQRIGGTPAITSGKPYMTLDAEDILRMAPDGIILLMPRPPRTPAPPAPTVETLRTCLGRLGTLDIPALRRGHIARIDDPYCLTPSTALLNFSEELERILKAWAS